MRIRLSYLWLSVLLLVTPVLMVVNGCGEKIAIPQPEGLFGISVYRQWASFQATDLVTDIKLSQGRLYTLTADTLYRRNLTFEVKQSVSGLSGATALCVEEDSNLVFVWLGGSKEVNWYSGTELSFVGSAALPEVDSVVAMAVNDAGIDQVPGAVTYLYLSDPVGGVVHRYAYDPNVGLTANGILARSAGDGARSVHQAGGLATDSENNFLVCDTDTNRNWVIRFDATPDVTDLAIPPETEDPLRGFAVPFVVSNCLVPPGSDFVLGFADTCGQAGWSGGPSDKPGEFHTPSHLAVDGSGRIYVTDTDNDRVQVFFPTGELDLIFGGGDETIGVTAIAIYDHTTGTGINYGAFVFVLVPGENKILKFISSEHADTLNEDLPPPPN